MDRKDLKSLYEDREKVEEYWDRTGAHTLTPEELEVLKKKLLYEHTWAITVDMFIKMAMLRSGMRVLDAGCGWGRTIIGLKKYIPDLKVTGIDITPRLINLAERIVAEETDKKDTLLRVGDVQNLEFSDSFFDAVLSTRVLQYVSNPQKAINEFARVLKIGGRVIVMVPNKLNPVVFVKYHTKSYSPFELKMWFENANLKIVGFGSIGYIPTIYRSKNYTELVYIDRVIRTIPILKYYGGLAMCIGEKTVKD
ncbi:MAG: methyltransferase domain-containing protein [Candidatus Omnitrophota bacterium]|nr:methyltransferase domain-containing protein [Candidatus Omnitrophota bacterium]